MSYFAVVAASIPISSISCGSRATSTPSDTPEAPALEEGKRGEGRGGGEERREGRGGEGRGGGGRDDNLL